MDVFVGNLSPRTTKSDLIALFKGFGDDVRLQVFAKQFQDDSCSHYAVATIEPDKLALKAIKKLSGQYLKGSVILLREYHHRGYINERRAMGWRDKPWHGVERRQLERRRKQALKSNDLDAKAGIKLTPEPAETVDPDNIKIEARSSFARKY